MFHAETSAPSALDLPSVISLSTIESPLTPDGDCVAGYRGTDTEKALDPRKGISEPSAVTSRASQKRCACLFAFRSRVRLGAVPRHGTEEIGAGSGALQRLASAGLSGHGWSPASARFLTDDATFRFLVEQIEGLSSQAQVFIRCYSFDQPDIVHSVGAFLRRGGRQWEGLVDYCGSGSVGRAHQESASSFEVIECGRCSREACGWSVCGECLRQRQQVDEGRYWAEKIASLQVGAVAPRRGREGGSDRCRIVQLHDELEGESRDQLRLGGSLWILSAR